MILTPSARLGTLLLGAALAGCQGVTATSATPGLDRTSLSSDGVNATLALQSASSASYCAKVTLANAGSSAVTGWTLVIELDQAALTQISGATSRQSGGTRITASPVAATAAIAPGASVSFEFCAGASSAGTSPGGASAGAHPGLAYLSVERAGGPARHTLVVLTTGDGTTSPPTGTYDHPAGSTVQITAHPASGAAFTGWSGDASGTANPITVAMDADRVVTAGFSGNAPARHTLTIAVAGAGSGTTTPAAGAHTYDAGASVTLTATPSGSATFAGWSGDATGTTSPVTIRMDGDRTVTATFSTVRPGTFANSVRWEDLADIDVFRVDDTFYYSASNMHYSPGAPILRSYDLVNWEYAGHSIPVLDFSPRYDLSGGHAYIKGSWASTLRYRKSNKTFYWGGCIEFGRTYIYTATSVEGPWQKHPPINNCYYDAGMLVDDDDKMYVSYGSSRIRVAELTADGVGEVRNQEVFSTSEYVEGSRFYKYGGSYYILVTRPANAEYVLRSTTGPFGPYTMKPLLDGVRTPVAGAGVPHQGGLVETQKGDWYYMAFVDAYPGGRIPVLAPIKWVDGWPVLQLVNGGWGASYPYPDVPPAPRAVKPATGKDTFTGSALGHEWEWNHNPDNARWSLSGGLRLQTATVTNDLYAARNTLTHRILGPTSTGTIELDYSGMKDGDRAGLALLRDSSAWIGVRRDAGVTRVAMVSGLSMDGSWNTTSTGAEEASATVSGGRIWLRLSADITPGSGKKARFSWSTDGVTFTPLGGAYTMGNAWQFFMGYRFGIFNYATQSLGGSVTVGSFELSSP